MAKQEAGKASTSRRAASAQFSPSEYMGSDVSPEASAENCNEMKEMQQEAVSERAAEKTKEINPVEVLERMKAELENARAAIAERDRAIAVQKELIERLNAALVGMCGVYSYDGR